MSADDPVDQEALIFTEENVFEIAGYLRAAWGLKFKPKTIVRDTERAIQVVLAQALEQT